MFYTVMITAEQYGEVYSKHRAKMLSVALRTTKCDSALAEDYVAEAFLLGWKHIHQYQGRSTLVTWLVTILKNVIRGKMRRPRCVIYTDTLPDQPVDTDIDASLSTKDFVRRYADDVDIGLLLADTEEEKYYYAMMAPGLNKGVLPHNTVKMRRYRAKMRVRQRLLKGQILL